MTIWLFSALTVVLLDQASKAAVLARRGRAGSVASAFAASRWRPRLRPMLNRGAAGPGRWALLLLWAIAAAGTIALTLRHASFQATVPRLGLGAALGGATANLVDILRRGAVVDFIDLRIWPVFNLADVAIVLGSAVALRALW